MGIQKVSKSLCVATALWELLATRLFGFLNPRPSHLAHRNEVELYTVVHMNIYWSTDHLKGYSDLTYVNCRVYPQDFHEHVKSGKLLDALHELRELCLPINRLKPSWCFRTARVNFSIRRRCFSCSIRLGGKLIPAGSFFGHWNDW